MTGQSTSFDRASHFYDQTRGFPPGEGEKVAAFISRVGGLQPHHHVLEIGVGTGRIALPLARHVKAIYGVDLSTNMMRQLRQKWDGEPIHLVQGDAEHLPFASHSFDAGVIAHVLHLVGDPAAAARELRRVLKPGAHLVVTHQDRNQSTGLDALYDAWEAAIPAAYARSPRRETIEAILNDTGWRPTGPPQAYSYTIPFTPRQFLENYAQRIWSMTWSMSDSDLNSGLQAVRAAIDTYYDGDADYTLETTIPVDVTVYV